MKRFAALTLLLAAVELFAGTVDVTYQFSDHTGNPQAVKRVIITPLSPLGLYNSTNIVFNIPVEKQTSTNGSLTVTNLANGYNYRVQLLAANYSQLGIFTNSIGTNVSGAIFGRDYLAITTNLGNGIYAYSRDQADARFQPLSTNLNQWATIGTNQLSSGATYTNTPAGLVGVITGSGIGTNTSHLVGTNQFETTIGARQAATNSLKLNATNGVAYRFSIDGTNSYLNEGDFRLGNWSADLGGGGGEGSLRISTVGGQQVIHLNHDGGGGASFANGGTTITNNVLTMGWSDPGAPIAGIDGVIHLLNSESGQTTVSLNGSNGNLTITGTNTAAYFTGNGGGLTNLLVDYSKGIFLQTDKTAASFSATGFGDAIFNAAYYYAGVFGLGTGRWAWNHDAAVWTNLAGAAIFFDIGDEQWGALTNVATDDTLRYTRQASDPTWSVGDGSAPAGSLSLAKKHAVILPGGIDVRNLESVDVGSFLTAADLADGTLDVIANYFAGNGALLTNLPANQLTGTATNLSGPFVIKGTFTTNTISLVSTGAVYGVSGGRAANDFIFTTNGIIYGVKQIEIPPAGLLITSGSAAYIFDSSDLRHNSGAQDLGRTSIPWGTGYFRNFSIRTNLFVTNSIIAGNTVTATNGVFGAYGHYYVSSTSATINTATNQWATWTGTNVFGGIRAGGGGFTNTTAGTYKIEFGASFTVTTGSGTVRAFCYTNGVATHIKMIREFPGAGSYGNANALGYITIPAETHVTLYVGTSANETITTDYGHFTMTPAN